MHGFGDAHLLIFRAGAATAVIIKESRWFRVSAVFIEVQFFESRLPVSVRGLVMAHQEKGLGGVALLEPVQGEIGNDIGNVTLDFAFLPHENHLGIVVFALPREDVPVVEASGLASQMPLANEGGFVASFWRILGNVI